MKTARSLLAFAAVVVIGGCVEAPVTGRSQLILVPPDQEIELGAEAYREVLAESQVSNNRELIQRTRTVGRRIAAVANDPGYDWEFRVIEDDSPNAFALPGGKVAVHTGLFRVAENDDQLAAVMGHEIAHAIARHSAERISQQLVLQQGIQAAGATSQYAAQYADLLAQAAMLGVILPYNRTQESEADHIGLLYMARAGYDPREAINLWRNFEAFGGNRPPEFMSTHPSPGTRIQRLQELMPEALAVWRQNR